MKETMNTLKTLASDTSLKEILDFLKEESQRQAARDDAFLKIMSLLVQQPHPVVTSPVIPQSPHPSLKFSIRHIFILFGLLNISHMCKSNIVHLYFS